MDFPTTRALIDEIPKWVDVFASRLAVLNQVPLPTGAFRWEHSTKDGETLQVAKAVRIASGLRAAMALADTGHTVECCVLLRTIADFAEEIQFVGEGLLEGRFTAEQQRFIEQHFSAFPLTPDELAEREREYYVGRKAMAKARDRISDRAGGDKELLGKLTAYLNKGYDSYVHGAYGSAMELYTGRTSSFMMRGHESPRHVCMARMAVAGKVKEALLALRFMAMTRKLTDVNVACRDAFNKLDLSGEDTAAPCRGL